MRFLQFWILPSEPSLPPCLEQRQFTREDRHNRLLPVIGPSGGEVVTVHQDATVFVAALEPDVEVEHGFEAERAGYLYVIEGRSRVGEAGELATGDAVKAYGPETLRIGAVETTELILIDVPRDYTPVGVWAR
jgi:redox-sensitive bicupin YhaK (pirin superfamily)